MRGIVLAFLVVAPLCLSSVTYAADHPVKKQSRLQRCVSLLVSLRDRLIPTVRVELAERARPLEGEVDIAELKVQKKDLELQLKDIPGYLGTGVGVVGDQTGFRIYVKNQQDIPNFEEIIRKLKVPVKLIVQGEVTAFVNTPISKNLNTALADAVEKNSTVIAEIFVKSGWQYSELIVELQKLEQLGELVLKSFESVIVGGGPLGMIVVEAKAPVIRQLAQWKRKNFIQALDLPGGEVSQIQKRIDPLVRSLLAKLEDNQTLRVILEVHANQRNFDHIVDEIPRFGIGLRHVTAQSPGHIYVEVTETQLHKALERFPEIKRVGQRSDNAE